MPEKEVRYYIFANYRVQLSTDIHSYIEVEAHARGVNFEVCCLNP